VVATAGRVGGELRALESGVSHPSRADWTAAEVGAHLASLPHRYIGMPNEPTAGTGRTAY